MYRQRAIIEERKIEHMTIENILNRSVTLINANQENIDENSHSPSEKKLAVPLVKFLLKKCPKATNGRSKSDAFRIAQNSRKENENVFTAINKQIVKTIPPEKRRSIKISNFPNNLMYTKTTIHSTKHYLENSRSRKNSLPSSAVSTPTEKHSRAFLKQVRIKKH